MSESRLALGFVSGMDVSLPFFSSVILLLNKEPIEVLSILSGPVLHRARNELVEMYLRDTTSPTLLMVDSDIEFSGDDVDAIMAHDEPIVSGVYPQPNGDIITDGCGFLRIDRTVLEAMGPHPFNPIKTHENLVTGEDVGFRFHARQAGYEVAVDHSISLGHVKTRVLRVPADALVPA